MPWSVSDDEFSPFSCKETIRNINGDLLLSLGGQAVEKEREVDVTALRTKPRRVALKRGELVVKNCMGFVEQSADERALSVVDAARGDEAQ